MPPSPYQTRQTRPKTPAVALGRGEGEAGGDQSARVGAGGRGRGGRSPGGEADGGRAQHGGMTAAGPRPTSVPAPAQAASLSRQSSSNIVP